MLEGGGDDVFEAGFGDFEIGELVVFGEILEGDVGHLGIL
ncbi:MAG: hypothetical protein KatS3mg087_0870 [Patescibacteria group bacterium]|nr:MAG: hypothetical protein KatS3mg087_0870 [Patescibacteria group bacterium]